MKFKGVEIILGKMGNGKTLYMSLFAKQYRKENPNNIIYSNFHLNLPNCVYSPFLFLPIDDLHDCLILADDYYNLKTMNFFISIISCMSRKMNISLLISAQRFTMIDKTLRELSDYEVKPYYDEMRDILSIVKIDIENESSFYEYENAVQTVIKDKLYNTNEKVLIPIPSKIMNEIIKFSNSKDELETNVCFYTQNTRKQKSMIKELSKEIGIY